MKASLHHPDVDERIERTEPPRPVSDWRRCPVCNQFADFDVASGLWVWPCRCADEPTFTSAAQDVTSEEMTL